MKIPNPNEVAARLLKIPMQFGSEVVFERRTLRIGWRWHLQDFPEGWDKPRDLQAAVEAIIKAAETTNELDGVAPGQLELGPRCSAFAWCKHRGEHTRHESASDALPDKGDPPPKKRAPAAERCREIRRSEMPQGKVYEERCIKPELHKGRHEYDGEEVES